MNTTMPLLPVPFPESSAGLGNTLIDGMAEAIVLAGTLEPPYVAIYTCCAFRFKDAKKRRKKQLHNQRSIMSEFAMRGFNSVVFLVDLALREHQETISRAIARSCVVPRCRTRLWCQDNTDVVDCLIR